MVATHARMSEAEYLAYDAGHDGKHEFVNGEVVAMAGATEAHSVVQANVLAALVYRLRGGGCRAHGADLRVRISETGMYAYPDVTVVCGGAEFAPTKPETLLNPKVLFEVLSESTLNYDLGAKASHYRQRQSVASLVFIDSRRQHAQGQTRNADGNWTLSEMTEGSIHLPALNLEIPFTEIYEGWTAPPAL